MSLFLQHAQQQSSIDNSIRTPLFFTCETEEKKMQLLSFIEKHPDCRVVDTIESQLKDIIKLENPKFPLSDDGYAKRIGERLNGQPLDEYGVWVYYPWRNMLVHLLGEEEFIRVRTIRNAYKITFTEQELLRKKKVGIIGLSVGQSVSLAVAIGRIAGELRLADFDTLELSNLNRIRTGIHHIGLKKTTIVAREIAEIDPYIKVVCFDEGITDGNIDSFVMEGGKLDLIAEECDSIPVKIKVREYAKAHKIPVVMDTSDRGMIDIERFDLEPERPIFHGLLPEEYNSLLTSREGIQQLTMQLLEINKGSKAGVFSLMQIGKTITAWPQLGTDVFYGGAILARLIGEILIGNDMPSGRNRLDVTEHYGASNTIKL